MCNFSKIAKYENHSTLVEIFENRKKGKSLHPSGDIQTSLVLLQHWIPEVGLLAI